MKPAFPTYIIKRRAKLAIKGKLFKAFCAAAVPMLVTFIVSFLVILMVPDARDAFAVGINGQFESLEAREIYMNNVTNICIDCIGLVASLFSFLSVGGQKMLLDILRGKEVHVKNLFCYFGKWHIAIIYPALQAVVTYIIREMLDALLNTGVNTEAVTLLAWAIQIALYFISAKLMFFELALADCDCTSFFKAAKASWRMVGMNTVVNLITLFFSFMLWFIASAFTGGIVLIYLLPYISMSIAVLYDENLKYNT